MHAWKGAKRNYRGILQIVHVYAFTRRIAYLTYFASMQPLNDALFTQNTLYRHGLRMHGRFSNIGARARVAPQGLRLWCLECAYIRVQPRSPNECLTDIKVYNCRKMRPNSMETPEMLRQSDFFLALIPGSEKYCWQFVRSVSVTLI